MIIFCKQTGKQTCIETTISYDANQRFFQLNIRKLFKQIQQLNQLIIIH